MTRGGLRGRIAAGHWVRLHRGVVFSGPVPDFAARCQGAVLAVGEPSGVAGEAAVHLWGLGPRPPVGRPVRVLATATGRRPRTGRDLRSTRDLAGDTVLLAGTRVLTVARLVLEQAADLDDRALEHFLQTAQVRCRLSSPAVRDVVHRHPHHRSAARLRRLLADGGATATESQHEERLLRLLRAAELPEPVFQLRRGGRRHDAVFREEGVVVKVDAWSTHRTRAQFEDDRAKAQVLAADGLLPLAVTDRQLARQPYAVVARIAAALAARRVSRCD